MPSRSWHKERVAEAPAAGKPGVLTLIGQMWQLALSESRFGEGTGMPKEEWGIKHRCEECGAKFYDLLREPIVCPVCGKAKDGPKQEIEDDANLDGAGTEAVAKDAPEAPEVADDILDDADIDIEDDDVLDDDSDTVPLDDIKNVATEDEN